MIAGRTQAVRQAVEEAMAHSFVGALSPRPFVQRTLLPFGIPTLDALTGGGVPVGAVTEFTGAGSTGKTSAAMQLAAGAMRSGRMCAWVDASDSFDPHTGAANGMLLPQLLWVRCGEAPGTHAAGTHPATQARGVLLEEAAIHRQARVEPGRCSSHPRGEEQGLDRAVSGLFQAGAPEWPDGSRTGMHSTRNRQGVGTPGAPNVPIATAHCAEPSPFRRAPFRPTPFRPAPFGPVPREEQVASDRLGGRKQQEPAVLPYRAPVSVPSQAASPVCARTGSASSGMAQPRLLLPHGKGRRAPRVMSCLDQALRAADLLLQGGGFSVLVLDLGSIAPEHGLRIPAATWFRFRAVAEASGTACILLSQAACARSSAALVLQFKPLQLQLAGGAVVESVHYEAELARQRFQQAEQAQHLRAMPRKQPRATWQASPYPVVVNPAPQVPAQQIGRTAAGKLCQFPIGDAAHDHHPATADKPAPRSPLAWKTPAAVQVGADQTVEGRPE